MEIHDDVHYADASGTPDPVPERLSSAIESERQSAAKLLDGLAFALHKTASHLPGAEARKFLRSAGSKAEGAARYVQEHGVREVWSRAEREAHRRPAAAIVIALTCGYVIGRMLRPR